MTQNAIAAITAFEDELAIPRGGETDFVADRVRLAVDADAFVDLVAGIGF